MIVWHGRSLLVKEVCGLLVSLLSTRVLFGTSTLFDNVHLVTVCLGVFMLVLLLLCALGICRRCFIDFCGASLRAASLRGRRVDEA